MISILVLTKNESQMSPAGWCSKMGRTPLAMLQSIYEYFIILKTRELSASAEYRREENPEIRPELARLRPL